MINLLKVLKKYLELLFLQEKIILPEKKRIFIFLAADYGNLGDIAITRSQEEFLNQFQDRKTVVIPMKKTYRYYYSIKKQLRDDDIITLIGGGNFGDLYFGYQLKRIFIIKKFKNKTISFPQTIFFNKNATGKLCLKATQRAIERHPDFTLIVRDSKSLRFAKKNFETKILLAPDIVMLKKYNSETFRKGITVCLRKDKESGLSTKEKNEILQLINNKNTRIIDTQIYKKNQTWKQLDANLSKLLDTIASSELLITDRLHGMIFAQITKTPCLVLNNNNNKIKNTYDDWLKKCDYIKLVSRITRNDIDKMRKKHISKRFTPNGISIQEAFR